MRTGGDVSLEEAEEEVGKSTLVGVAACVPLDYREKKGCSVGLLLLRAQLAAERIYRQSGLQAASTESAMAASASCIDSI